MGDFLIRFVVFISDPICVCVCGLLSAGTFSDCEVVGFQPLKGPDMGCFFHAGRWGSNPWRVPVL